MSTYPLTTLHRTKLQQPTKTYTQRKIHKTPHRYTMCPIKHMHQLQPTHQLKPTPRIQNQPSEQSNELKNTHTHKRFQRSSLKEFFTPAEQNDPDGRGVRTFAKSAIYNAFWPDDSRFFIVCYLATSKHPRGVFIHCSPRFEKWSFPR